MEQKEILEKAREWIAQDPDSETVAELEKLLEDAKTSESAAAELADRMSGPLAFGTAGLRGIIGAGEHRMNRAVVIRTTAGLARYLCEVTSDARDKGIVIGYDGRHGSSIFALDTALTLAGSGIKAFLYPKLVPTPLVAYAVGKLGCAGGVMVTASHNPPEYNGYKLYWSNAAQIIPPHDSGIAAKIASISSAKEVHQLTESEARAGGLLESITEETIEEYFDDVTKLSRDRAGRDGITIVYTAMHGVGYPFAKETLRRYGFDEVIAVPEQRDPDGEFPTLRYPNPEEPGALDLAIDLARTSGANLVLANDPDADRLAVAIPTSAGDYRQLSGNEVGVLLGEYLLRKRPRSDGNEKPLVVTTIVSSPMLGEVARRLGAEYREVLTGFKWMANTAIRLEQERGYRFIFAYEEALGYSAGTTVRDKDGISAAALFAELTAVAASEGRTVENELERLARAYGLFMSTQRAIVRHGANGAAELESLMDELRRSPPVSVGNVRVVGVRDYLAGVERRGGMETKLTLPKANVMIFELDDRSRIVARPSGTEPKVKFYFDLREEIATEESFDAARGRAQTRIGSLVDDFFANTVNFILAP